MKLGPKFVSFLCAAITLPVFVSAQVSRSMMICGADFIIGMKRESAHERIAKSLCKEVVMQAAPGSVEANLMILSRDAALTSNGTLKFQRGVLTKMYKSWEVGVRTPQQLADTIINLFQRFQSEGNNDCLVGGQSIREPGTSVEIARLQCGNRGLELTRSDEIPNGIQIEETLE